MERRYNRHLALRESRRPTERVMGVDEVEASSCNSPTNCVGRLRITRPALPAVEVEKLNVDTEPTKIFNLILDEWAELWLFLPTGTCW